MRIAIAQINTHAGDFEQTSARMRELSLSAAGQGADLVVFPLAALTGPQPVDYPDREGFQIDLLACLEQLAKSVACPCLVPAVTQMDGESFHEVMLLQNGTVTPLRARSYVEAAEQQEPSPCTIFEFRGLKLALALTYEDLDDLIDAALELDVVVYVSDYSYALDDTSSALGSALAENRFKADAMALDAWLVGAGSVGGYGPQTYAGASFVLSPQGNLAASAPAFEESLLLATVAHGTEQGSDEGGATTLEPELYNRTLHLWEALGLGLRDFLSKQGRSDVALVLDGGLASCLLATLASDALGPTHVYAVVGALPGGDRARTAQHVANALHLLPEPCAGEGAWPQDDPASYADAMQLHLARVARATDAVPLSAEDKTYLALEVRPTSCKAAELLPFGDVYRTDLVELAHMRNTVSPVIPAEAFKRYAVPEVPGLDEAEPTPEMRLKRVDVTLATYVEWERPLSDVVSRQGAPEVTSAIVGLLRSNQAAREAWPTSLMASSRPLSAARSPLGCAWADHVRNQHERLHGADSLRRLLPNEATVDASTAPVATSSASRDMASLLDGLQLELQAGNLPTGSQRESLDGALGELMGLLQDLLQSDEQPPSVEGPFGPLTWGSPFSEN